MDRASVTYPALAKISTEIPVLDKDFGITLLMGEIICVPDDVRDISGASFII